MFQYCNECVYEITSTGASSWVSIIATAIALLALMVAAYNLYSLRNAQSLTAKISLINVETELRKSHSEFKNLIYEVQKTIDITDSIILNKKRFTALERYIAMADKLANLIIFVKGISQYNKGTDWKAQYFKIFEDVILTIDGETRADAIKLNALSKNVNQVFGEWGA